MPWDSIDKSRDEDLTERRKRTRRIRWRGGRRKWDEKIIRGLQDINEGKGKSLEEFRKDLERGGEDERGSEGICDSV